MGSHRAPRKRPFAGERPLRKGVLLVAAPIAAIATVSVISVGIERSPVEAGRAVVEQRVDLERLADRAVSASRSGSRIGEPTRAERQRQRARNERRAERRQAREQQRREAQQTTQAVAQADTRMWTTADLNIWTESDDAAEQLGVLDDETKVLVTGRAEDGREELVLNGAARWVTAGYLAENKPEEETAESDNPDGSGEPSGPGVGGECTNGTSIARPVSPNLEQVYQAVCANFPEITTYGTLRSDGEHSQGLAVDIMVRGDRGWQVAEFVKANASELGVNYAIFSRNIWSVQRSSEGWRAMEDRGSVTANHEDHVHVTTY